MDRISIATDRPSIRIVLLLAILVGSGPAAFAQATIDEMGEKLVNDFVNDVITLQGRFEQSLIDAEGAVVEVSSGTLEIERPTRFRWTYADPYEQWLLADGVNIWSYDVDLAQVTVKPQAEALSNTPALLLGGGSDALEQFLFDGTLVENGTTWVRLRPRNDDSSFNRLELGFFDAQLSRMVFYDNLEQTTVVAMYDVVVNEPIDAERFVFVVPDDADLVGVPLAAGDSAP